MLQGGSGSLNSLSLNVGNGSARVSRPGSGVKLDLNGPADVPFEPLPDSWVDVPIIASLRQVAARHPGQLAIRDRRAALTYCDLVARVSRASAAIRLFPVRHGAVGLLLPNSAAYPVAVLACLAAGRAVVPFDLSYPAVRNAPLVRAASLDAVVVAGGGPDVRDLLPDGVPCIDLLSCLDHPVADWAEGVALGPDDPAAVLHTSGSSGRPKPIVVSKASLLQRVLQYVNASHVGPWDQLCPLISPCTISGMREQMTALLTGATLQVLDVHREGLAELRGLIGDRWITAIYAVPAMLRAVMQADGLAEDFASLRIVRLGGDTVLWRDVALLREAFRRRAVSRSGSAQRSRPACSGSSRGTSRPRAPRCRSATNFPACQSRSSARPASRCATVRSVNW